MPTLTTQVDWRKTHIALTQRAAYDEVEFFGRDAAVVDAFARRKKLHRKLDLACSAKSVVMDKAERLHSTLDRFLNRTGFDLHYQEPDEEPSEPEEEPEEFEEVEEPKLSKRLHSDSAPQLDPSENAQVELANFARRVDINRPEVKNWYQIMWNVAAKLNPICKIKDMPKSVVDFCLARIGEAG